MLRYALPFRSNRDSDSASSSQMKFLHCSGGGKELNPVKKKDKKVKVSLPNGATALAIAIAIHIAIATFQRRVDPHESHQTSSD